MSKNLRVSKFILKFDVSFTEQQDNLPWGFTPSACFRFSKGLPQARFQYIYITGVSVD